MASEKNLLAVWHCPTCFQPLHQEAVAEHACHEEALAGPEILAEIMRLEEERKRLERIEPNG